jgi:hypothetical protein
MFCNTKHQTKMKLPYLNIVYFLYYQKMTFLYNDFNSKKPKKLTLLSHSPYNLQPNVYNNYSHVNKYIKNKL